MELERRRQAVLDRLERACRHAGRDPREVRVVAVTKSVEPAVAEALHDLGVPELGENRVDEFERKAAWFRERGKAPRWHFVGHLQRNKARRVVRLADEIHSLDSLRLIRTVQRLVREEGRRPRVYLQVKLADEDAKSGLAPEELPAAVRAAEGLELAGLMTLAPLTEDEERARGARRVFERLAELAATLPAERFREGRVLLSMGMSGDLEQAIAAGADLVRIGSAFFRDPRSAATTRNGG